MATVVAGIAEDALAGYIGDAAMEYVGGAVGEALAKESGAIAKDLIGSGIGGIKALANHIFKKSKKKHKETSAMHLGASIAKNAAPGSHVQRRMGEFYGRLPTPANESLGVSGGRKPIYHVHDYLNLYRDSGDEPISGALRNSHSGRFAPAVRRAGAGQKRKRQ